MAAMALTLYGSSVAASTLPSAGLLSTTTNLGSDGIVTTKISNATGYGEIAALGTNAAWASLAGPITSIAPTGLGWLLDSALLHRQTLVSGLWTPAISARITLLSATADLYLRAFAYNTAARTYTSIGILLLSAQSLTTSKAVYTWAGTSLAAFTFNNTQRLYIDCWPNILTNANGAGSTAQIAMHLSILGSGGIANDLQVSTPGFTPPGFTYGVDTLGKYIVPASLADLSGLGIPAMRVQIHNASVDTAQVVNTTSATAISPGVATVTPASMSGITVGQQLFLYGGTGAPTNSETTTVTAVTGSTFTATFAQAHSGAYVISGETYTWTTMDTEVNLALSTGMQVVLTLEGFASWWQDSCGLPTWYGMQAWGQQVIERYGNLVVGVEMGNEEFAFVSGSCRAASVYYNVISQVYGYLKALNPSLTVGHFGYTNYSGNPGTNGDPAYWFGQLCALGGAAYVDYFNFHYYNGGDAPTAQGSSGIPPLLTIVADINTAQSPATKPIRVTEFGWQNHPSHGSVTCPNNVGDAQAAAWLIEAYTLLQTVSNITHGFFYTSGTQDAGFYDCHDVAGTGVWAPLTAYFAGTSPPPSIGQVAVFPTANRRVGQFPAANRRAGLFPTIDRRAN